MAYDIVVKNKGRGKKIYHFVASRSTKKRARVKASELRRGRRYASVRVIKN